MWYGHLERIEAARHRIELTSSDVCPIHSVSYPSGPKARVFEMEELDKMTMMGMIQSSHIEWVAPIVFAPKKYGTHRFCVDYGKLNAVIIGDAYATPRMDECIDSLGHAKVFSTLDGNCGYWQVEMYKTDWDKTAFTSPHGLFGFVRMPFGMKNAPATFQRSIDVNLSSVSWQHVLVYQDDVVIFSKTPEGHTEHVRSVLALPQQAGVTLKLKKCVFSGNINYLGHIIRPGKLEVAEHSRKAIERLQPPRTITQLRSFLGLCNVFQSFIPHFTRVAAPRNRKLRKGEPVDFGDMNDEEPYALATLQKSLSTPPFLALPRAEGKQTVETDACDKKVACVRLQEQSHSTTKLIGYWYRYRNGVQRRYDTTQRELLAFV